MSAKNSSLLHGWLFVQGCLLSCYFVVAESGGRDPDFSAQLSTMSSFAAVEQHIDLYKDEHGGRPPGSLDELHKLYELRAAYLMDGWNRKLYYYTTGNSYVLASFGRSGRPEQQDSPPGEVSQRKDFEVDFVVIDGEWAQSPRNVDR